MYLGISSSLEHRSPEEWAAKHKALGLDTVNFPALVGAKLLKISVFQHEKGAIHTFFNEKSKIFPFFVCFFTTLSYICVQNLT